MPIDPRTAMADGLNNLDASGADLSLIADAERISVFKELGASGLKRMGGYVDEEFLPQLRGRKAVAVYKEMSENDPLIGALLFAIKRLLRNVEWSVEPAGKDKDSANAAKLLETAMEDMSHSWSDFVTEALSMLPYGWSWHEIVYKRRGGLWATDSRHRSAHSDGLVGWRKMPIRAQETLLRWAFDETGDVKAMIQMAPPRYATTALPIKRSLLFRYEHLKGNPEGLSMLRNAYRPWFMKKRLEEFEAVGIERDLAGMPIVKVPAEMLRAKQGSEQYQAVENFKKMVKSVRRNEQEGLVFPQAYDQDTKQPLYNFELLGGGGARAFNTDATITRYETRMLQTVLADFIMVGHENTGSYSMHVDKTGIFRTALNSIAQSMADTLNRHAVPRLFLANGWKPEQLPKIVVSDVDAPDIAVLAQFMSAMAANGITWFPDPKLENFVREAARLPKLDEDESEALRQMQMRTEATAFAQANAEYLSAQQQQQMASMSPAEQAIHQGVADGAAQAAAGEASGATAQAEQEQAQAAEQAELEQGQAAEEREEAAAGSEHERMLAEREMTLKERQAQAELKLKDRAQRTGEKQADKEHQLSREELRIKAKQGAAKPKPKPKGKAKK